MTWRNASSVTDPSDVPPIFAPEMIPVTGPAGSWELIAVVIPRSAWTCPAREQYTALPANVGRWRLMDEDDVHWCSRSWSWPGGGDSLGGLPVRLGYPQPSCASAVSSCPQDSDPGDRLTELGRRSTLGAQAGGRGVGVMAADRGCTSSSSLRGPPKSCRRTPALDPSRSWSGRP